MVFHTFSVVYTVTGVYTVVRTGPLSKHLESITEFDVSFCTVTESDIDMLYSVCMSLQEQYVFVHDAVLEFVVCGDTQIVAADLRKVLSKLGRRKPHTQLTGYTLQFRVSHLSFLKCHTS